MRYPADNITYLLDHGAAINAQDADGQTPLLAAIRHGSDPEAARLIIARHADVKAKGKDGYTAIRAVAEKGWTRLYGDLLSSGADPNTRDADGNTLLLRAVANCQPEVVALLLDNGADPNLRNQGHVPIIDALELPNLRIFTFLLQGRSDPNVRDADGVPVLFRVVDSSRADMLDALIGTSCDLNVRFDGRTALMQAVRNRDLAMVRLLVRAGADLRAADRFGATPIEAAKWDGDDDIARILAGGARRQPVDGATRRM